MICIGSSTIPGETVTLKVNWKEEFLAGELDNGYVRLTRKWKDGDAIELNLPMPVRRVAANDSVRADRGRIALQRGPIVYCLESPDNPDGHVRSLMLPDNAPLAASFELGLLNGVEVIRGSGFQVASDEQDATSGETTAKDSSRHPYFAWANRGRSEMMVWVPDSEKTARVQARPTIASTSKVTFSAGGKNPSAINDLAEPASSNDAENTFFDWWPRKGANAWVEYAFPSEATVSTTSVYWFDDTGTGECPVLCLNHGASFTKTVTSGNRSRPPIRSALIETSTIKSPSDPSRQPGCGWK